MNEEMQEANGPPAESAGTSAEGNHQTASEPTHKTRQSWPFVVGGVLGCGCLGLTAIAVVAACLLSGGPLAVAEQLGLRKTPAEQLVSEVPNYHAADMILSDLAERDISTRGVSVFVFPVVDEGVYVAIAVLDGSEGFRFDDSAGDDPYITYMTTMVDGRAASIYPIDRVIIDYRDDTGFSTTTTTVTTESLLQYNQGEITRDEFLASVEVVENEPEEVDEE